MHFLSIFIIAYTNRNKVGCVIVSTDGQIISQTSDDIIAIISSYFITDWIYCRYICKTEGKVVKHNDKNDM